MTKAKKTFQSPVEDSCPTDAQVAVGFRDYGCWFQSPVEDSCPTDGVASAQATFPAVRFSPLSRIHAPLTFEEVPALTSCESGFSPLSRIHAPLTL